MSRDDQSHASLTSTRERRMRDDSGADGAHVLGYQAGNGETRVIAGDEKFPFVMVPPDLGKVGLYTRMLNTGTPVGATAPGTVPILSPSGSVSNASMLDFYARGATIDVREFRHLTFYLSMILPDSGAIVASESLNNALAIIPQVANSGIPTFSQGGTNYDGSDAPPNTVGAADLLWHTISVVDPYIRGTFPTAVTDPATAYDAPLYGFRNVHMTQLQLPYQNRVTGTTPGAIIHSTLVFDVAPYEYFRLLWARTYAAGRDSADYPTSDDTGTDFVFSLHLQGQR